MKEMTRVNNREVYRRRLHDRLRVIFAPEKNIFSVGCRLLAYIWYECCALFCLTPTAVCSPGAHARSMTRQFTPATPIILHRGSVILYPSTLVTSFIECNLHVWGPTAFGRPLMGVVWGIEGGVPASWPH